MHVPRPSLPPVFDHLHEKLDKGKAWERGCMYICQISGLISCTIVSASMQLFIAVC